MHLTRPTRTGYWELAILALAVLTPMLALLVQTSLIGDNSNNLPLWQSSYIQRVIFFSLWQALVSAGLSILFALLVARALAHYGEFPFRGLLLKLFGLPLVVPSIVAVMGVVSVYRSNGSNPRARAL